MKRFFLDKEWIEIHYYAFVKKLMPKIRESKINKKLIKKLENILLEIENQWVIN